MVDASSHERLWSLRFSQTTMIVAITSAVVIFIVGLFCIIAYTPIRTFIPGYPDAYSRRQAIQNAQRIDSLETSIIRWQLYSENLRRIVTGQEPIRMDSLILGSKGSSALPSAQFLELRDSLLRADVSAQEQFGVSSQGRILPIEAQTFFPPIKGVISCMTLLSSISPLSCDVLKFEAFEYLAHFLNRSDPCGYEGEAQDVFYEPHLMEQGLDAGRVAIDEE